MADYHRSRDLSDNEMDYSGGEDDSHYGSGKASKRKDMEKGDKRGGINRVNRALPVSFVGKADQRQVLVLAILQRGSSKLTRM